MIINWVFLTAGMAVFLALGIILGFLSADRSYHRALLNLINFARRMISKTFVRSLNRNISCALEQIDRQYSMLGATEKLKYADPSALQALHVFHHRLTRIYGAELLAIYFYGSRMRGSFVDGSDLDVVIFFDPAIPLLRARPRVWREVLAILLQYGLLIQPRLANGPVLDAATAPSHPFIHRAVRVGILIV